MEVKTRMKKQELIERTVVLPTGVVATVKAASWEEMKERIAELRKASSDY
jgi:hypothetical protein